VPEGKSFPFLKSSQFFCQDCIPLPPNIRKCASAEFGINQGNHTTYMPTQFGGGCVKSGPFSNMTVNLGPISLPNATTGEEGGLAYNPRCLKRDVGPWATQNFANYAAVLGPFGYFPLTGCLSAKIQFMAETRLIPCICVSRGNANNQHCRFPRHRSRHQGSCIPSRNSRGRPLHHLVRFFPFLFYLLFHFLLAQS
jgi:hypothetical protein